MNLVADESIDRQIIDQLRGDGHTIWSVTDMAPSISDREVLRISNRRTATLVTADKDYGELVFRQRLAHHGVVLVRLGGMDGLRKAEIVAEALSKHGSEIVGNFAVISAGTIRIRRV